MDALKTHSFAAVLALALAACEDEQPLPDLPPRAIKHMTIGETAGEEQRTIAGVVNAGTRSNVAFETGGRVIALNAGVGDQIDTDDILAQLDPQPFELEVEQAEFSLEQAEATLEDARSKYEQQRQLWEKRLSTRTAYDTALANFRNAQGQVGVAKSQLDLRRRDLRKTDLVAPFPGRIAQKEIEVFEEVAAGQPVFVLQTEGENEVEMSIPENIISNVSIGQEVSVVFPPLGGATTRGRVTEVSPQAGNANAFPVTVRLEDAPDRLRPGMSAEITLSFATDATGDAFTVPVSALKADVNSKSALVYVFDPDESVVRERPVRVVGINGNEPQIVGELQAGDVIATAGVGHMHDGMKVRLLDPDAFF